MVSLANKPTNKAFYLSFALLILSISNLFAQGLPGVGIGIGVPGVGVPVNIIADYPNPYANKAPAYRSVYLYRSAELQALSNGKPTAIRSLFFSVINPQSALLQNFTIRMKQVSWNDMPVSIPDEDFTTVYSPKTFVETKGYNEHAFDVPFCWDGVSNFIVDICVQNQAQDKSLNALVDKNIPDNTLNSAYHDWNETGNSICLKNEAIQAALYQQRPLSFFASIPRDSTDLRMLDVLSPAELIDAESVHPVKIKFQNYSCPMVSGVKLAYQWNEDPPVVESFPSNLSTGQVAEYTFSQQLAFPKAKFGVLKTWTQHPDDKYAHNDTLVYLIFVKDEQFTGLDYAGTDFWIAFMQNYANQNIDQKVFITSTKNTSATVAVPLLGWTTTVNVPANTVVGVAIPLLINGTVTATEPSEVVSPTGVHVTADEEISVYGYSGVRLSTDAYLAVPRRTLGRKYTVFAPEGIYNPVITPPLLINAPAEFIVVGTENNTEVEIIPNQPTELHEKNDTIRLTLNQGETFLVKARVEKQSLLGIDTYSTTYDLTGSQVKANKKIGLIGGSMCAYIPGITQADKCQSCDHLLEMQTAPHTWGKTFYASDFEFKPGDDVVRLVNGDSSIATVDFNGTNYTVPRNGFTDVKFQGEIRIQSDIPIQALQMCTGGQCTLPASSTDPFISSMVPESQWGNYYTFATPVTPDLSLHYINIVKKTSQGRVGFDGKILNSSLFKQIGSTDYYIAKLQVPVGVHKVSGDSILFVNVYGFGRDNSYGYPASGSLLKAINILPPQIDGAAINIKCFGDSTGSASANAINGTPPYSFYWSNGKTGERQDSLKAGNYWVVVEDDYGYQDSLYFTITQAPPLKLALSSNNISCFGKADGSAQGNASGGTAPYSYRWSNGATSKEIRQLTPGKYYLSLSDANNCEVKDSIIISEPPQLTANVKPVNPSCFGFNNGSLHARPSGGLAPYTFVWQNNISFNKDSLTQLPKGSYTLSVFDAAACKTDTVVSLTEPNKIKIQFQAEHIGCFDNDGGSATAQVSGGTGSFQYNWKNTSTQNAATVSGLATGWHQLIVTDAASCSTLDSIHIDSVPSPVFKLNTNSSRCEKPNGSAEINATGGTGNYNYSWETNPPKTGKLVNNLAAGNYTVNVSDGRCSSKLTFTIGAIKNPSFDLDTNATTCGLNNGKATLKNIIATGQFTITWLASPPQTGHQADSLAAGNYRVVLKDSVCTVNRIFNIPKTPVLELFKIEKTNPDCGLNNGSLEAFVIGGTGAVNIKWLTNPVRFGKKIDQLSAGNYQLEISDSLCSFMANVSLADKNAPQINFNITEPKCGLSNGQITATIQGSTSNSKLIWNGDTSLNMAQLSNLAAGSYSLIVSDNGCLAGKDTTLTDQAAPLITISTTNSTCNSNNGGAKVNTTGGTGNYTYSWNGISGSDSIGNLTPGTYQLTVSDGRCTVLGNATIAALSAPKLSVMAIDSSYCDLPNGQAYLSANGGTGNYNITWNTTPIQYGFSATGLKQGNYQAVLFDGICFDTIAVNVFEIPKPKAFTTAHAEHCQLGNGSAQIDLVQGTAPFALVWSTGDTTSTIDSLKAAWYRYTLTDKYCFTNDSVEIVAQPGPEISIDSIVPLHCELQNGMATVKVNSALPYTVTWSSIPVQTGLQAINLNEGNYTAIVKTAFCSDSVLVSVAKLLPLAYIVNNLQAANCGSDIGQVDLMASGGNGNYRYSYNNLGNYAGNQPRNLSKGWLVFTISDDYCSLTDSVFIPGIAAPIIADTISGPDWCGKNNGFVKVIASGGTGTYTYAWQGLTQTGDSIGGLASGNYTLVLSDGLCTTSHNFTIETAAGPSAAVEVVQNEICGQANGRVKINALKPENANILWSTGETSVQLDKLSKGLYSLNISNLYCDTSIAFTIIEIPGPNLSLTAYPDTCKAGVGAISINASGGKTPYQYEINGNKTVLNRIDFLGVNNYNISVKDDNQCTSKKEISIENVNLSMPSGQILFSPIEPYPGDEVIFTAKLPLNWTALTWKLDNQVIASGNNYKFKTPNLEGEYNIVLSTKHRLGCTDEIGVLTRVTEDFTIYIPNSFTPEGDGYNELFYPITTGITQLEGYIFNRFGEVIYTFNSLNDKWDGTYKGLKVKSDSYAFRMIFTSKKGKRVEELGKVTLLK